MNVDIDFNNLTNTVLSAAKIKGLAADYVDTHWSMDYETDQNKEFNRMVKYLNEEIKLLSQALERKDFITAKSAIIMAKVHSHNLMNFFENINDDIVQLGWGDELKDKWPKIPEDYKVPDHYDYEDTNKPYSQQISDKNSS